MKVIFDRSAFHGDRFDLLKSSRLSQLVQEREVFIYHTAVFLEETFRMIDSSRQNVKDELRRQWPYLRSICKVPRSIEGNWWRFRCDCGGYRMIRSGDFYRFNCCASCVKKRRRLEAEARQKMRRSLQGAKPHHGQSGSAKLCNGKLSLTHKSWRAMKKRCFYGKHDRYPDYGGLGITVCDRWLDFSLFLEDGGPTG
jgi:hypothetical protein